MTSWKVTVDRGLCIGSGMCVVYAPNTFTHDDEAIAVVVDQESDPLSAVQSAAESCPTTALQLTINDQGE